MQAPKPPAYKKVEAFHQNHVYHKDSDPEENYEQN